MNELLLARMQFGLTSVYHFIFVPLTMGLSLYLAITQTVYVATGDEKYKRMVKFWGKLFLINFGMGVATGIVQEFQFGMAWSEYSRFVGDIFGAPLAGEALMAFFIESTFLGVWIFGWDKLPKPVHLASIWLVAIASNISAYWILVANSWMQQPVGYEIVNGRAQMTDFVAILTNPNVLVQWPHVIFASILTAAFFVLGISAYHLLKDSPDIEVFKKSFQYASILGVVSAVAVVVVGHTQAQHMVQTQPMKMAAAEALWNTEDPAAMSLFTIGNEETLEDVFSIRLPGVLSLLAYNRFSGEVQGLNQLQAQYETLYGPGDYTPPIAISYWSFRTMVGFGMILLVLSLYAIYLNITGNMQNRRWFLHLLIPAILLPYVANTTGWILAEVGRAPWLVFGLQTMEQGLSPNLTMVDLWISIIVFSVVYISLIVVDIWLIWKFASKGTEGEEATPKEFIADIFPPLSGPKTPQTGGATK
ncbi:MAG: cytochrome ubiquinol oxidase subunit I [Chloroflexi bacterium]|nr:cytochrome ubiquinol oxidase subunit I [Chloroflexota bacterium]